MEFFKGIQLYLKDVDTGLLGMKFICTTCGKVMDEPEGFFIPCAMGGAPLVHKTEFYCNECYKERSQQWQREKKI